MNSALSKCCICSIVIIVIIVIIAVTNARKKDHHTTSPSASIVPKPIPNTYAPYPTLPPIPSTDKQVSDGIWGLLKSFLWMDLEFTAAHALLKTSENLFKDGIAHYTEKNIVKFIVHKISNCLEKYIFPAGRLLKQGFTKASKAMAEKSSDFLSKMLIKALGERVAKSLAEMGDKVGRYIDAGIKIGADIIKTVAIKIFTKISESIAKSVVVAVLKAVIDEIGEMILKIVGTALGEGPLGIFIMLTSMALDIFDFGDYMNFPPSLFEDSAHGISLAIRNSLITALNEQNKSIIKENNKNPNAKPKPLIEITEENTDPNLITNIIGPYSFNDMRPMDYNALTQFVSQDLADGAKI